MRKVTPSMPIVESGRMTQQFRLAIEELQRFLPRVGDGSPEGVIEAPQFSLYIDESGSSGSIEYRKMQADIAGDKTKGWVAV